MDHKDIALINLNSQVHRLDGLTILLDAFYRDDIAGRYDTESESERLDVYTCVTAFTIETLANIVVDMGRSFRGTTHEGSLEYLLINTPYAVLDPNESDNPATGSERKQ